MKRTMIQHIASTLQARANCQTAGNNEWFARHTDTLRELSRELPSGSGVDSGSHVDVSRSTPERVVISTAFHHMNEGGMYDGWTEHSVIITPSLQAPGFNIRITGRDRNGIKEYLAEMFDGALSEAVELTAEGVKRS